MYCYSDEWATAIRGYQVSLRVAGRPETTVDLRVFQLKKFATEIRPADPWQVCFEDVVEWLAEKPWAPETRRSYRSALRGFYGWGVESGRTDWDPAGKLPKVAPSHPRPHPATEDAYRFALIAAEPSDRLALRLAAELGLRRGEVSRIHSRDIIQTDTGWSLIVHGKGSRERILPLPDALSAALRSTPPGYAFAGSCAGHVTPAHLGKRISRLLPEGVSMHALRHRFATLAYSVDRDVFAVQRLLGHASPDTTQRYVQVPDDDMRRLVAVVQSVPDRQNHRGASHDVCEVSGRGLPVGLSTQANRTTYDPV